MAKKRSKKSDSGSSLGGISCPGPSKTQERKWQAEDDARTLSRAQEIQGDKGRLTRAVREANRMAANVEKEAKMLRSVASEKGKEKA